MRARRRAPRARSTGRPHLAALVGTALVATTCTGAGTEISSYEPRFKSAACPADVTSEILLDHRCGYLTVPEHRSKPAGRTIELFVLIVEPPGDDPPPDPLLSLGGELGEVGDYSSVIPVAARVNRQFIVLEPRGSARSRPSLACSEVAAAEWELLSIATSDPAYDGTFLAAASACYERLVAQGVDPAAYNVAEMAADVEDLRTAMDIEEWNVTSIGDSSLIALEVMRRFPEHLRSVILDSPTFPSDGGFTTAAEATRQVLDEVARACRVQPTCIARFPDVADAFDEAVARLEERPVRIRMTVEPGAPPIELVVDGGMLVRLIRWYAAGVSGAWNAAVVPAMVYDALHGRYSASFDLLTDHPTCIGYHAVCDRGAWTHGLYYSVLCHDGPPITGSWTTNGDDLAKAFAHPYAALCGAWRVPAAEQLAELVQSDVPTLILVGLVDPLVSRSSIGEATTGLSRGFVVSVPGEGANLLSRECPREIRNAWLEDPITPPDTTCLQDLASPVFIAPIAHDPDGGRAAIPDATYRVALEPEDGLPWGLDAVTAAPLTATFTLGLHDGRFRFGGSNGATAGPARRRDDWVGVYRGDGQTVTFVVDRPFIYAGLSWSDAWRTRNDSLLFHDTEMSSREDALFYPSPIYLDVLSMWMESHPWRRVDRTR